MDRLRRFLKLPHEQPSDDTFRRIFTALDPKGFVECFIAHVAAIRPDLAGSLIAIDGKIHFAGGDYLLALKANHGTLHGEVAALFADAEAMEYGRTKGSRISLHDPGPEKGHGRIEHRVVKVTDYLDWFEPSERKH